VAEGNKSKVAVVVVHGVAYHAPGASARAVSELLHGLRSQGKTASPYGADTQVTVSIPLQQLAVTRRVDDTDKGWFRFLQERTVLLTQWWRTKKAESDEPENEQVAHDFMRLLLQDYRGVGRPPDNPSEHDEAASYVTTRIQMTRAATPERAAGRPGGGGSSEAAGSSGTIPEKEVHLYEMYWADLARPKNTILSFFVGIYQLLFHVGSLSRLAISSGANAPENRDRKVWNWLDWTQVWAVRTLTLPIPILNLILAVALFTALPRLVPDRWAHGAAAGAAAILGLAAYAFSSPRLLATKWPLTWALAPLVAAVGCAWAAWLVSRPEGISPWSLMAMEIWVLGLALVYLSVSSYDEVRNGAKEATLVLYGLSFLAFALILVGHRHTPVGIERTGLWTTEVVLFALRCSWALLFALALLGLVLGSYAWRSLPDGPGKARAKASVRTSRFALATPTVGILIVTLALWSGLFVRTANRPDCQACPSSSFATKLFGEDAPKDMLGGWLGARLPSPSLVAPLTYLPREPRGTTTDAYFRALLVWSATPAFSAVLLILAVGLFLMLLWLVPSILSEGTPPRGSANAASWRMGRWLSRGLDATAIVFCLFWIATFLPSLVAGFVNDWLGAGFFPPKVIYVTAVILKWLGVATGSLAILASVAKSGSSALGIILDVDNYLRTSPKEKTPRARIVERYVSLLRYLERDGSYDRVVILAHSLGALISGDLLLFLNTQGDPQLKRLAPKGAVATGAKIPIRLYTMGDPARQFLNRMLPYLYEWVRPAPDNGSSHLGSLAPTTPDDVLAGRPDPARLGVERWVNAYRSGDYIGRSLWLNEWYARTTDIAQSGEYPQEISVARDGATPPVREEMCIGAGAHQHYWDQSAPDIAEKLDELIAQ
jgi:hypothetical protein